MGTGLGDMTLEGAAKIAGGNWRKFECFGWHRAYDLADADQWAIVYTHHRDAGLLDQSNVDATRKVMEGFYDAETDDPDVLTERHGHFAVGWIEGFAIRVYRDGQITEAFKAYHGLAERMAGYPVLDEADFSHREYEATVANISEAARPLRDDYDLPDGWEGEVFSWLWDNNQRAVESRDDLGGYPKGEELREAFEALGYGPVEG